MGTGNGDLDWSHVVSVVLGGSGASFFIRLLTKRAMDQLDDITKKLENCTHKLLVIETEILSLKYLKQTVASHERKIIELDVRSTKLKCQLDEK